jgi:predicted secreted protein
MVKNNMVIAINQNFNDGATWELNSELSRSMVGTAVEVTKNANPGTGGGGGGDFWHIVDLSAAFNRCPGCKCTCVSHTIVLRI